MSDDHTGTYPPLNTLKPVDEGIWIVDGPIIRFGFPWPKMPFPTRMTIIRLDGGKLFIHSPTPLTDALKKQVDDIGAPAWIVGPNRIHYWWIPEWREAFPEAEVYLAPRIREQAGKRIDFPASELAGEEGYPWDASIRTLPVQGRFMTEVVFFHRESKTLILTDLIENFEAKKLPGPVMRFLTWIGSVQHPDGQTPRDLRLTFLPYKDKLKEAVQRMIAWEPERIIVAHGRWYDSNGAAELRRAFRWLID